MHRYTLFFTIISLLFPAISISGCSEISGGLAEQETEKAVFTLDSTGYAHVSEWNVICSSGTGIEKRRVAADTVYLTFTVQRDTPAAVLAYPVPQNTVTEKTTIHPAGGIYPFTSTVSMRDGFSADLLASLYAGAVDRTEAGSFCVRFNWDKFIQSVRELSSDPWNLDKNRILRAIVSRTFTQSMLKPRSKEKIYLP